MQKRNYKGALRLDWVNKELSLYYEIDEKEGKGVRPAWVPKNDIRVAEPRILRFQKSYGDVISDNMLIKGDNLLVLRSLIEMFKGKPDKEKVKCIYIDPPFNTGNAFEKYDDNLEHSQWLTMMRDRLALLIKLLRSDGALVVHIDHKEKHYLKVLMDEVCGRRNFVCEVTIETRSPSGYKIINPGLFNAAEYLLIYAKEKTKFKDNPLFRKVPYDKQYSWYLANPKAPPHKWKLEKLREAVARHLGHSDYKTALMDVGKSEFQSKLETFAIEHASKVVRIETVGRKAGQDVLDMKIKSQKSGSVVLVHKRKDDRNSYFYNGGELVFYAKKIRETNGVQVPTMPETNIWTDIGWEGIQAEGGVKFKYSKKPEKLLRRIVEYATKPGELVLDSFLGSGTTCAVAHKMGRKWIGVELGEHARTLCLPRIKRVVDGKDQSGISKEVQWQGGSGFKYYQLGESVIHEQDMNWSLKAEEMAEAVFLHYQYRPIKAAWLEKENMFLGKHQSARYHFALSFASRDVITLTENLYEIIVTGLDKEKFRHLTIFTNVAVSVPPDSLDDRVLVKKIPAAILREYNLL